MKNLFNKKHTISLISKGVRTILAAVILFAVIVCPAGIISEVEVEAKGIGTTYYVDSVNGSDTASGTSARNAWKTLDQVNNTQFGPGDKILFKAGTSYKGQLFPKGSGQKGAPIRVDMYGNGPKPVIIADGRNSTIVTLYNQEYFEFSNLEITSNNNPKVNYAVRFLASDYGTVDHIYMTNCYIHNVAGSLRTKLSGGIFFTVTGTAIKTNYNDILVENNTIRNVDRTGITLDAFRSWSNKNLGEYEPGTWYPSTNVVIRGNFLDSIGGDGIVVKNCLGALVEYNTAKGCNARASDANAGIWTYTSTDTIVQHNEAYNTRYTHDGEGFDVDSFSENTVVQYNYSHDNEGGFLLVCSPGEGAKSGYYTRNTYARYNISQNDGNLGIIYSGNIENTNFFNNTIYVGEGNTTKVIDSWDWGGAWAKGGIFANNLIYNLGTGDYDLGEIDIEIKNNIMYGNHPMTEPEDPQKITDDPGLVAPGSGGFGIHTVDGYMLKAGSIALGAGIPIKNCGTVDYFGNKINAAKPNIGAYGGAGVTEINKKGVDSISVGKIKYIYPVFVSASTGTVPQMPKYIPVRLTDGTEELVKVQWNDVKAIDKEGAYIVYGKMSGVTVSATVTVEKALVDVFEKILVTNQIVDWTVDGDKSASYIDAIGYSGKYCLSQYDRIPFNTSVSQKLENIENGVYTFYAYVNSNGTHNKSTITVKGDKDYVGEIKKTNGYEYFEISGINVTDNDCEVIIATDGKADSYVKIDETYLVKEDARGVNLLINSGFDVFDATASAMETETKETFAVYGKPTVDGVIDDIWENAITFDVETRNFTYVSGNKSTVSATAKLMWDNEFLYVLAQVKDHAVSYANETIGYLRDSVEVVLDERNQRDGLWIPHNETCAQWRVGAKKNDLSGSGNSYSKGYERFTGGTSLSDNGYIIEMAVPFYEITPQYGAQIGFEMQINDDNGSGTRTGIVCWNSPLGESWQYTDVLGIVNFINDKSQMEDFTEQDIVIDTETPSSDSDKFDYSKYKLPALIVAVVMLLIVSVNITLLVLRRKRG